MGKIRSEFYTNMWLEVASDKKSMEQPWPNWDPSQGTRWSPPGNCCFHPARRSLWAHRDSPHPQKAQDDFSHPRPSVISHSRESSSDVFHYALPSQPPLCMYSQNHLHKHSNESTSTNVYTSNLVNTQFYACDLCVCAYDLCAYGYTHMLEYIHTYTSPYVLACIA